MTTIDPWPTDADMADLCGCGHTLGQHHYGLDLAPCHECTTCEAIHDPGACAVLGHDHRTNEERRRARHRRLALDYGEALLADTRRMEP